MGIIDDFAVQIADIIKRTEKLELNTQPILGDTIIASDNTLYIPIYSESPSVLTRDAFTGGIGLISYVTANDTNAAPSVQFVKESDVTLQYLKLYITIYRGDSFNGVSYDPAYPKNIQLRLNPTLTRVVGSAPYYRGSGGTILTMDGQSSSQVTPTSDGQTYTYTFTDTQLASSFITGMNNILLQQEYDSPDSTTYGYGKMVLVGYGYKNT